MRYVKLQNEIIDASKQSGQNNRFVGMTVSLAPMEGITGYPFRNTWKKYFGGADRYYTPFLVATQTHKFKKKELRDVAPENNEGIYLIPQVLTNTAEHFIWAVSELYEMGYREINLNMGCPYPTVVSRHKGAGMLADPDLLDRFFDTVFTEIENMWSKTETCPRISVKTRIGMSDLSEAERITDLLNAYPFSEIIIHPRLREEFYDGEPHRDVFAEMYRRLRHPVCYNGDLFAVADVTRLRDAVPDISSIMIGRGILRNPALVRSLRSDSNNRDGADGVLSGHVLRAFLDELFERYRAEMSGDQQVMFKMKELWSHLQYQFPDSSKAMKKLKKARSRAEYEAFLDEIFENTIL